LTGEDTGGGGNQVPAQRERHREYYGVKNQISAP